MSPSVAAVLRAFTPSLGRVPISASAWQWLLAGRPSRARPIRRPRHLSGAPSSPVIHRDRPVATRIATFCTTARSRSSLCAAPVLFLVVKHPRDAVGGAQPNMLMPSSSVMLRAPATGRMPAGQGLSRARGLAAAAGVAGAITLLAAHQHHATALNGAKPRHAPRRCGACVAVWGVTMHPLVGRAVWAPLRRASQPDCQPASRRPTVCTPGGCN
jgi:hypothetical protein